MERNPENKMGEDIIAALSAANNYLPIRFKRMQARMPGHRQRYLMAPKV